MTTFTLAIAPNGFCGAPQVVRGPVNENEPSNWQWVAWRDDLAHPGGWPIVKARHLPIHCLPAWAAALAEMQPAGDAA